MMTPVMSQSYYESQRVLQEYLLFHYGEDHEQMPWSFGPQSGLGFPQRCVEEGLIKDLLPENARALDLGCAVGRQTFELARYCSQVIGIDYSHAFILTARTLCRERNLPFEYIESGTRLRGSVARVPDIDCSRVFFEVGDAQNLRPDLGQFDVLLMANLLCRLPQPRRLLERLPELVNPGGQLIITTPNTWLESFTDPDNWIGGQFTTGTTLEVLTERLQPHFDLQRTDDLPFLIREHERKYQWSVAQLSVWTRTDS